MSEYEGRVKAIHHLNAAILGVKEGHTMTIMDAMLDVQRMMMDDFYACLARADRDLSAAIRRDMLPVFIEEGWIVQPEWYNPVVTPAMLRFDRPIDPNDYSAFDL